MSHYAIGDIQGCYSEFMQLLDKIQFDEHGDILWLTGDIINGGKENLAVLRFLSKPALHKNVIVLGNHDLHYLAVFYGIRNLQTDDTFQDILNAPDVDELTHFLQSNPLAHYDSKFNTLMIHAGILPDWTLQKTLDYAQEIENCLQNKELIIPFLQAIFGTSQEPQAKHWRLITDTLTRIRFCDKNHALNLTYKGSIDNAPEGLHPWFQLSQLSCNIVFGHWAALTSSDQLLQSVSQQENIYPLDTGCVWGGKLTALRLEDKKIFQIPGKKYR